MELLNRTIKEITDVDRKTMEAATARVDQLIKPIGSLGILERIGIQVAGITGNVMNRIEKKCTIVMSADNGVCEEGVSAAPQAFTAMHTMNFAKGITGINVLSRHAGADVKIVDIGINADFAHPLVLDRKVRKGTANMAKGPAMSREEAIQALETGIEMASQLVDEGYQILGTGEMGIGNTSTSSAVLMTLTGCSADVAVGKGAGLTEEDYDRKKRVIEKAIAVNKPDQSDAIDVLAKVGGLDIAGMAGCFLGAAAKKVPIVIDGFISAAAALIAYRINPLVREYMIPSHESAEPGYNLVMKELGLKPILKLEMRLGEGSGCPLAFHLVDAALAIVSEMATFDEAMINDDFLVDIREEE